MVWVCVIAFACCLGNVVDACNHVVRMNTILTSTFTYVLPMTMNLSSGYIDIDKTYGYEQSRLKGHPEKRTFGGEKACCGQVTQRLQDLKHNTSHYIHKIHKT